MIYTTGSIEVSGNTLTGTGTNFSAAGSLIRNGCTVLALTSPAQTFQITAINGATSLTVTPAASPAVPAGTKFAILLSDSLSVDGLAQDIAETFTMYQRYMGGFSDVMTGTGDVTITINGQPVTVPGQKALAKKGANSDITSLSGLTTALSIEQGGTGGKTKAEARASLSVASSGANTDITSITGLTTPLAVSQGGTGATTESGVRQKIGAAASGLNSDISQISGLQIPVTSITSIPGNGSRGIFAESVSPTNYDVVTKTLLSGLKTNNWSLYSSFGMYGGGSGTAAQAGPAVCVTDGGSFGARWFFRVNGSVISTANGDITPSVSDERVKNIIREITEEEAVAFITGVRPIRYALKWTPEQVKVGYSAQNIESLDPEIISTSSLSVYNPDDGSTVTYEDGKILDPGEVGAAYLVPVVQQLLRRVSELEAAIKALNPQGS